MHTKIHFIGIGEAIMADLAIVLHQQGYIVTGSTVELEEAMARKLVDRNILPRQYGFFENHINSSLACIIIGRKIERHNVELNKARELGIPIYSYTEYIYQYAQDKQRIIFTGDSSTTALILAMAIHVMGYWNRSFDYVGNLTKSLSTVKLSDAPVIFLQGDTYAILEFDQRIQSFLYQPHIVLISDMDMNYCKTDIFLEQYTTLLNNLADNIPKAGALLYNADIPSIQKVGSKSLVDVKRIAYRAHVCKKMCDKTYLITPQGEIPILYSDKLVLEAISATYYLLKELAITEEQFYKAIIGFTIP